ncbi:conserved membrane hypothetical protein [Gammaproteobacteria bacterium]
MKFYTAINKVFLFIGLASYNLVAYAGNATSKNEIARRLLTGTAGTTKSPSVPTPDLSKVVANSISGLAQLIKTLAILGGVGLILFSIQLYIKHRKNPMETSLSMVIMVFFIGLVLIALSFTQIKF